MPGYNTFPSYGDQPNVEAQASSLDPATVGYHPQSPPTAQPQTAMTWTMINRKNWPQFNSAAAATLVFICGGMNLAWSIGISADTEFVKTTHMQICWFIGAIIGAVVTAVLCNLIQKKLVFYASIVLILMDGVLNLALWYNFVAIMAARYMNGLANGLLFVPVLMMAGEEAVKARRAMIAGALDVSSCYLGVFVQVLYVGQWTTPMSQNFNELRMQGLLTLLAGVTALLMTYFLYVESPVYFLLRNQDEQAIDSLRRLQQPCVLTQETYDQLEDHQRYVAENMQLSFLQSAIQGLPALLKLCYFRAMIALGFSAMMFYALFVVAMVSDSISSIWTFIIFGALLYAGSVCSVFTLELTGRKKPIIIGAFICGGLALGIALILGDLHNFLDSTQMSIAMGLIFVYQFFSGYYTAASSAYLSEAFPLDVKPYYIAIAYIVEMLVGIIICCYAVNMNILSGFFYALASLSFGMVLLSVLALPETKLTTLSEAQAKFRKIFNTRFNFSAE